MIQEILLEYDGCPVAHIWKENQKIFYCHSITLEDRWLCASVNNSDVELLKRNEIDIFTIMSVGKLHVRTQDGWETPTEHDLQAKPKPGVFLFYS